MTRTYTTSIKRKVMTVILLASIAVLLVTVAAFVVYDLITFREAMVQNLVSQGRLIAENTSAALAFNDENDASNVLASLRTEPHVIAAAIYNAQGKLFAQYPVGIKPRSLPPGPQTWPYRFEKDSLVIFQPVVQSGAPLGTVYLRSDLTALTARLQLYGAISLLIMFGSFLVALLLSNTLQRRISNPIIALAKMALTISEKRDYSLRASRFSNDELGLLTDSFNDMLERIQNSDSALRASEAQFRLVTDQAPVLLAHMGRDYCYKFVNKPYAANYGMTPADMVGKHARDVVGDELFETARPYVDKVLAGQGVQFELEIINSSQERRWSHVEYTPEKNSDGEVIGFVAVHTDITQRKRVEMEMEQARDQALAASRAKDDFLAALSHELRTPLNPVLLIASDAAANEHLPAAIRKDFETIGKNIELEARLIDDLLDLTRITRGKLSLETRIVDLHNILEDAISNIRTDIQEKHIDLSLNLKAAPSMVKGDAVRLQQVFWNILKNAVKFTPPYGKIAVHTSAETGCLAVQISDTGIGLTRAELDRVFQAFSQGDHAIDNSHRFGGLGLGLAISRQLVEMHSGHVQAVSEGRNQGATFIVDLPLAGTENNETSGENPKPVSLALQKKATDTWVLLVEDHEPTRQTIASLLLRRGYQVLTAGSLREAREIAGAQPLNFVISDIGLPDGSGNDLMAELRQRYGLRGIALTGYGMEKDVELSLLSGFVTHLTKPIQIHSLENALAAPLLANG